MRALLLIALALLASGCANTIEEIRANPPLWRLDVAGRYQDVASCVAHRILAKDRDPRLIINERDRLATITLFVHGSFGYREPFWELTFVGSKPMTTTVDLKTGRSLGPPRDNHNFRADTESCAAQS